MSLGLSPRLSPRLLRCGVLALVLSCWPGGEVGATSRPVPAPPTAHARAAAADTAGTADAAPIPAPITLSDPDGQALTLTALSVKVAVDGPLSLTELEIRFKNPQARRIEGRFALTLPDGATISRFAKEVSGQLVEGEVIERMAAHRAYDAILHEMRDPALLEQDSGNRFSAKVFPIEANADVRIVLSYTRLLRKEDGARAYVLPLRGLPAIGSFAFHGRFAALPGERSSDLGASGSPGAERSADGVQHLDIVRSNWAPDADVAVRWRASGTSTAARVLRSGDYYVASFQPDLPAAAAVPARWAFYVDTSASVADGEAHRIAAIEALLRALPPKAPVAVYAFDQDVVPLVEGSAATAAASIGDALRRRGFAGGTDLERVLARIAATARPDTRVVLATDGVATFGDTNPAHLAAAARALPQGVALHALVLGSEQDGAVLAALTDGRGRVVEVPFTDAIAADAAAAAARLSLPPGARFTADDRSASWVHAVGAGDVTAGGEVIVVGRILPGQSPLPRITRPGAAPLGAGMAVDAHATGPLVEREAVRVHLADLAIQEAAAPSEEARAALADEQVRLSVAHRVLCPKTTMLVLESEADYVRFGLDRRALADILTVTPEGIGVAERGAGAWGQAARDKAGKPEKTAKAPATPDDTLAAKDLDGRDDNKKAKAEAKEDAAGAPMERLAERGEEQMSEDEKSVAEDDGTPDAGPVGGSSQPSPPPSPRANAASAAASSTPASSTSARPSRSEAPRRARPSSQSSDAAPSVQREVESNTVAAEAAPPPTPSEPEAPAWIRAVEIPSTTMAALEAAVAANPRDREAMNQLANALVAVGDTKRLATIARAWQPYDPDNPHIYELMGEAALANGDLPLARRAFGSLAELAGGKPELLQRAGLLLWRAGDATAAEVPLRRAIELRPDRVNAHRHLALVLRATGRHAEAVEVLEAAVRATFPDYYQGVNRVLLEELGAAYRDWIAAAPGEAATIRARARTFGADPDRVDALRVTLAWETDGNDVDLHVVDPRGESCFYGHRQNVSGLELYEDLTRGLGPEVIRGSELPPGRYAIGVKYFSAGPMGVSRGLVIIEERGRAPRVEPFRLVEGGGDVRLITTVDLPGK
ncbi:MAG: VIT domain-containing protein [Pseudomonadota bacterium]|nr:VIT domain-containing protein [Pseudomonadota bacterium]